MSGRRQVTLATGACEAPLLFENNDLPGVMLTSAARRLDDAVWCPPRPRGGSSNRVA